MEETNERKYLVPTSILIAAVIISMTWLYVSQQKMAKEGPAKVVAGENTVSVDSDFVVPIPPDLYARLTEVGAIDKNKVGGELSTLNLLWAFGLANKNAILEQGPMMDPKYNQGGGLPAGGFASTGGWTLAKGDPMDHYSMHKLITLTPEQQQLVERVSKKIYRPCCNNSTYFPDCNHGMAMLGLLELLASKGADEQTMYRAALKVNAQWFPAQYATIGRYLTAQGSSLTVASPEEILGPMYSSGSGFAKIAAAAPVPAQNRPSAGGGCNV